MLLLEFLYVSFILRHISADVFPMIVVIGERRVDFRQAQLRVCGYDFVRALALLLMQDNDILHADTPAPCARDFGFELLADRRSEERRAERREHRDAPHAVGLRGIHELHVARCARRVR